MNVQSSCEHTKDNCSEQLLMWRSWHSAEIEVVLVSMDEFGSQSQEVASPAVAVVLHFVQSQALDSNAVSSLEARPQKVLALRTGRGRPCGTCYTSRSNDFERRDVENA